MKKFYLTKCIPHLGNREINSCFEPTKMDAAIYFNAHGHLFHEPVSLDQDGYQKKQDGTMYCITEPYFQ